MWYRIVVVGQVSFTFDWLTQVWFADYLSVDVEF